LSEGRPYRQCTRCVMDTSDPDIHFDAQGHCNHCTHYFDRLAHLTYRGAESDRQLAQLAETMRGAGRGSDFDCVVGLSGGADSCYAARLMKGLGLRTLAVHLDNGWNSDTAVKNIKRVAGNLGIEYMSYVLDWDEFRDLQLAFVKASVLEIETPTDMAIPGALHRVAAEHGVRHIVSGGNYATEGILPAAWHYNAKDLTFLRAIHARFGTRRLRTFPTFGYRDEAYYKMVRRIRLLYPLNHVPYAKTAAKEVLRDELGWEDYGGKHHESRITAFVQSYLLPVKFDLDYRKATLSTGICSGETTRDEALRELAAPPFDATVVAREKEYMAKKFEVGLDEFEEILARPPRTYRDYPNDEKKLQFVYGVYRRFFAR
jgi:N-acetyl sugar amidotransferase